MKAARFFSLIVILSILGITTLPNAYGAGKRKILRNDDFVRKDGVEGNLQDVHCIDEKHAWLVGRRCDAMVSAIHREGGRLVWKCPFWGIIWRRNAPKGTYPRA